jgi:hypothetical protein
VPESTALAVGAVRVTAMHWVPQGHGAANATGSWVKYTGADNDSAVAMTSDARVFFLILAPCSLRGV